MLVLSFLCKYGKNFYILLVNLCQFNCLFYYQQLKDIIQKYLRMNHTLFILLAKTKQLYICCILNQRFKRNLHHDNNRFYFSFLSYMMLQSSFTIFKIKSESSVVLNLPVAKYASIMRPPFPSKIMQIPFQCYIKWSVDCNAHEIS